MKKGKKPTLSVAEMRNYLVKACEEVSKPDKPKGCNYCRIKEACRRSAYTPAHMSEKMVKDVYAVCVKEVA